jgi:plasmid stabilization system protein ParE
MENIRQPAETIRQTADAFTRPADTFARAPEPFTRTPEAFPRSTNGAADTPGSDPDVSAEREYARNKIERGLDDISRRRTMPHEDVLYRFTRLEPHDRSRVCWTTEAYFDLKAIRDFIERDSSQYAWLVLERLVTNMEAAEQYPETLTRATEHASDEVVELALGSYRLVCNRHGDEITVLTVLSSAHLLPLEVDD